MFAGLNTLVFEPKMKVDATQVGTTATPKPLQPRLGALANIRYKPCRWHWFLNLEDVANSGAVTVRLMAGDKEIRSETFDLEGLSSFGNDGMVHLSAVAGETALRVEVEVNATANVSGTLDSWIAVELPLTVTGCG